MSNTISVQYDVPVRVVVNLETGKVERVVVLDESIEPDYGAEALDADSYDMLEGDDPRIQRAYDVANKADVEWPRWTFGW